MGLLSIALSEEQGLYYCSESVPPTECSKIQQQFKEDDERIEDYQDYDKPVEEWTVQRYLHTTSPPVRQGGKGMSALSLSLSLTKESNLLMV